MNFKDAYQEHAELYDQAFKALGHEEALEEFKENNQYDSPFDLLDQTEKKKVAEVAEAQAILNGESGSLPGMDYIRADKASD